MTLSVKENNYKDHIKSLTPFILLFIYFLAAHCLITIPNQGDDAWFKAILNDKSIFDYWNWRYQTWSSRLVIETILIIMTKSPFIIWCVLDTLAIMAIGYSFAQITGFKKNSIYKNWIIVFFMLLYPATQMASAGWMATTINYLWPLAAGLIALIPLKKIIDFEKVSISMEIVTIFCILFAGNTEQMGAILLCIYAIIGGYLFYRDKKIYPMILLNFIILLLGMFFILMCPGNSNRSIAELHWLPEYEMFTSFYKCKLGFLSTTLYFFEGKDLIYFLFIILLLVGTWNKEKNRVYRFISILPCLFYFCVRIGTAGLLKVNPNFGIYHMDQPLSQILQMSIFVQWLYVILNCMVIIVISINIFILFKDKKQSLIVLLILGAGFVSRIIMGFSPTLFASGERTFIYLYASIILASLFIIKEMCQEIIKNDCIKLISFAIGTFVALKYLFL